MHPHLAVALRRQAVAAREERTVRSELFGTNLEAQTAETFTLQNSKMLRVALRGEVMARQGSMVAYQGRMEFDYEGSGGVGRFIKKALTGEGVPLMRCRGEGDLFLAHDADEVHLVRLEQDALTVNGPNVLAFEPGGSWDIRRVEGASMFAGGLFNTVLSGSSWVAITAHGTPVVLQTWSWDPQQAHDLVRIYDEQMAVIDEAQLNFEHLKKTAPTLGTGDLDGSQLPQWFSTSEHYLNDMLNEWREHRQSLVAGPPGEAGFARLAKVHAFVRDTPDFRPGIADPVGARKALTAPTDPATVVRRR